MEQTELRARLEAIRSRMAQASAGRYPPPKVLAVTKTHPAEEILPLRDVGLTAIGENRVQELCEKYAAGAYSGKPLHFIGHLQTNKVRQVVGRACMIESVGSHRLLECVAAEAQKQGIRQDILVEINIGAEASKSGIAPEELNHVWERYYRASSNMVRASEGSGLGLSIVKEILSLHKSNFGVDSTVGNGTTFWFELNFVKAEKMRNVLSSPEASPEERNK